VADGKVLTSPHGALLHERLSYGVIESKFTTPAFSLFECMKALRGDHQVRRLGSEIP
jgi:hypothetical protein